MEIEYDFFNLPKLGNEDREYEDAYAFYPEGKEKFQRRVFDGKVFRVAIADGATESSFSGEWAKVLTDAFVKDEDGSFFRVDTLKSRIKELSEGWEKEVNKSDLPWYAREKIRLGSYATFLGIEFRESSRKKLIKFGKYSYEWKAVAIGDSCLFHIQGDELKLKFPVSSSNDFNFSPDLISTKMEYNDKVLDKVKIQKGEFKYGDIFILATDALAQWFLKAEENKSNGKPLFILQDLIKDSEYTKKEVFNCFRQSSKLKNDDITFIIIRINRL